MKVYVLDVMKLLMGKLLKKEINNIIKYILGAPVVALGISFIILSNIGASSIDVLHESLAVLLNVTIGQAMYITNSIMIVTVVYLSKDIKKFLIVILVAIVPTLIDLFRYDIFSNIVFSSVVLEIDLLSMFHISVHVSFIQQVLLFISGIFILGFGAALLVASTYPAGLMEELAFSLHKTFKTKYLLSARISMEISFVVIGLLISYIFLNGYSIFGVGSFILTLGMGPVVSLCLSLLKKVGLYHENYS